MYAYRDKDLLILMSLGKKVVLAYNVDCMMLYCRAPSTQKHQSMFVDRDLPRTHLGNLQPYPGP